MSTKPKSPKNKPKRVVTRRAELARTARQSIYPAQVLSPDQELRVSVKMIAARQLKLIEDGMAGGVMESDPAAIARFLKDVTVALKSVQEMERNDASDLTGLSDEDLERELQEASEREAASAKRLMDVLPRGKSEKE